LFEVLFSGPPEPEPLLSAGASFFDEESLVGVSLLGLSDPPLFFPEPLAPDAARESVL
jgi:hypothetical protein